MSTIVLVQKDTNRHTEIVRELTAIGVERVLVLSLEAFLWVSFSRALLSASGEKHC